MTSSPALRRKGFMRDLASLAGGAAAGQIIMVAASPIITRHYGPAEIGAFSVFTTTALLLNATNSVRYEMAIPVAEDEETAGQLVLLCMLLVVGFSLLLGGALWFWGADFCRIVKVPSLRPYLWLLPFTLAAAGFYEPLNFQAIRCKHFGSLAQSRVVQGGAQTAVQVLMGFAGAGVIGLVAGDLVGRATSSLRLAWSSGLGSILGRFRWRGIRRVAVAFVRFPKYMAGASILNLTAGQIPFLLIPMFFGPASAGHYFLAYRTLFMPASFIGAAISQVFLGEAAERAREGEPLGRLTARIFLLLAAVYLPMFTLALAGAGTFFPAVFGAKWAQAGHFAQVLAPMILIWSLARPISGMLLVRNRLKESLAFTVVELVSIMTAIYFGERTGSLYRTAVYISATGLTVSTASVGRFLHAAGVKFVPVLVRFFILTAVNAPLGLAVWLATKSIGVVGSFLVALAGLAWVVPASLYYLRREKLL